jgi:predicted AAA+ superfamily ATPase
MDRPVVKAISTALERHPDLLQVVTGPRQAGKTTAALTVQRAWPGPSRYAAADEYLPVSAEWIRSEWELARLEARRTPTLLVLDEVQKVPRWSEVVKAEWDADRRVGLDVRVLLLGSSALLLTLGLTESLAGRFLVHRCMHWSFAECHAAFGWDVERWIYFGGYPRSAAFGDDEATWRAYIRDALVETVVARDVLALQTVQKPALLRQLFALAAGSPAQLLSYTKMLGQLQDSGNTTTLAHYLKLLGGAYLASGLETWSPSPVRARSSSPKLVVWNNALVSALGPRSFAEARRDPAWWGRLVENAVGAHLLNGLAGSPCDVRYWRDGDAEVDYVVQSGERSVALEVKSGRPRPVTGLASFRKAAPGARALIVGSGGIPLDDFLATEPTAWLEAR